MAADYAALEARVAELEHQMRNVLSQKIDAVSYGIGIMHAEMTERLHHQGERLDRIELTQAEHSERFDAIDQRFDRLDQRLDSQGQMLSEILRRLPAGASNVPSGDDDDH